MTAAFFEGYDITFSPSFFNVMRELDNDGNTVFIKDYVAENKHCNEGLVKVNGTSGKTIIKTHVSKSDRFNFSGTGVVEFVKNGSTVIEPDYRAHMFIKDGELYIKSVEATLTQDSFDKLHAVPGLLSYDAYIPGFVYKVDLTRVPLVSAKLADFASIVNGLVEENIYKATEKVLKEEAKAAASATAEATPAPASNKGEPIQTQVNQIEVTVPYCTYSCDYQPTPEDIATHKGTGLKEVQSNLKKTRYSTRAREFALEQGLGDTVPWVEGKTYHRNGGDQVAYTVTVPYKGVDVTVTRIVGTQVIKVDA